MKRTFRLLRAAIPAAVVGCAVVLLSALPATADYGYFRTVEGYSGLIQGDTGATVEVEANYPVLLGDRVDVSQRGRLEAVLEDGSYLRLDGGTDLAFEEVDSESGEPPASKLRLGKGEIQLILPNESKAGVPLQIDTVNATIYVEQRGSYRIYTDGRGWTEIVVRDGWAEVLTERGSSMVRAGEQSTVNGTRWPKVTLRAAGGLDDLEVWGGELLAATRGTASPYVESRLAYAATPLARHGSWMHVGGRYAWRPAVEVGWRPYYYGRWGYTPAGLSWISPEPWGWVTYHYGYWDLAAGVGWVWYPGRVYTPAAVYWYWGPTHVAWVPAGYYHSYYRPHQYRPGYGFGAGFGVHGWAGGSINHWSNWTFCASGRFGRRSGYRDYSTGAEITRRGGLTTVPRGVIATDTRSITRDRWNRPADVMAGLTRGRSGKGSGSFERSALPDLSAWVARSPKLSSEATRALYGASKSPNPAAGLASVSRSGSPVSARGGRKAPSRYEEPALRSRASDSRVSAERRTWSREAGAWNRRKTLDLSQGTVRPTAPAPRDLVRRGAFEPIGSDSRGRDRSALDRSVTPRTPRGSSWGGIRHDQPSVQRPQGLSGGTVTTPPVRKVVEGMKTLRHRGRPGVTAKPPSTSVRHGGSLGSGARVGSTTQRGGTRGTGAKGSGRGVGRGSTSGSSSRSTRRSGKGGG